jgi:hypothetical protein
VDTYQASGFLNFHGQNWCVGGIVAYGLDEYDSKRHGILGDTITGSPNGYTGHPWDKGRILLEVWRLCHWSDGGLTFISVTARAYSETGDPVLTQTVRERMADDLYGTVGLQVNYNIKISRVILQPFVRAEYEHEFLADGTTIKPILPVNQHWNSRHVQNSSQNYGRIGGGLNVKFVEMISTKISADALVGRDDGYEYTVNAGIQLTF